MTGFLLVLVIVLATVATMEFVSAAVLAGRLRRDLRRLEEEMRAHREELARRNQNGCRQFVEPPTLRRL